MNKRETLVEGGVPITVWGRQNEIVTGSSYGEITYLSWCRLEVCRLRGHGRDAYVHPNGGERCCIFAKGQIPIERRPASFFGDNFDVAKL